MTHARLHKTREGAVSILVSSQSQSRYLSLHKASSEKTETSLTFVWRWMSPSFLLTAMFSLLIAIISMQCSRMEWRNRTRKWSSSMIKVFQHWVLTSYWIPSTVEMSLFVRKTCLKFWQLPVISRCQLLFDSVVISWTKNTFKVKLTSRRISIFLHLLICTVWET